MSYTSENIKQITGELTIKATQSDKRNLIFILNHLCKSKELASFTHLIEETIPYETLKEYSEIYSKELNQEEYKFNLESEVDFKTLILNVKPSVSTMADICLENLKQNDYAQVKTYSGSEANFINFLIRIYTHLSNKNISLLYKYEQYEQLTMTLTKNEIEIDWATNKIIHEKIVVKEAAGYTMQTEPIG